MYVPFSNFFFFYSVWLHKPKGPTDVPPPFFSPGIRKIIALSFSVQIMTQLFCLRELWALFIPVNVHWPPQMMLHCPLTVDPWTVLCPVELKPRALAPTWLMFCAVVIYCYWNLNLCFLHCAHTLWVVRTVAFPELDCRALCSKWSWASSGMNLLLPGRPG